MIDLYAAFILCAFIVIIVAVVLKMVFYLQELAIEKTFKEAYLNGFMDGVHELKNNDVMLRMLYEEAEAKYQKRKRR